MAISTNDGYRNSNYGHLPFKIQLRGRWEGSYYLKRTPPDGGAFLCSFTL
jgi:hypothetical protein